MALQHKLPTAYKSLLVKALRSGKYKKCVGQLYDKALKGFCPLGLACIVAGYHKEQLIGLIFPPNEFVKVPLLLREETTEQPTVAELSFITRT